MKSTARWLLAALLLSWGAAALADDFTDTVQLFKNAGESQQFFNTAYAYVVFPNVGEGAFVIGGAHGKGRAFVQGKHVGDATVTQVSVGFQAGGQAYSMIIFFEDKRAFDEFAKGNFEFGADVQATAITASAGASAGTTGTSAGASGGKKDATTAGKYYKGMAVFTIVKGGALYKAAVGGMKFKYKPKSS
ncbi:MAG TPA: lipid-binding SYLF domain-containing protein [Steroidobacteraceae bacterium]|nr:lipid-binding SYLF domain-containing protein [Steroidobacteraceae bacterium]